MADFSSTTTVDAPPQSLFDYLSDVGHLPDYFAGMLAAEPGDGEQVHTTAKLPDGQTVQGDAWFRVDESAKKIEWGAEGPSSYSGSLDVDGQGDSSSVTVTLHTTRVQDDDGHVQSGLEKTLTSIKRLVEEQGKA